MVRVADEKKTAAAVSLTILLAPRIIFLSAAARAHVVARYIRTRGDADDDGRWPARGGDAARSGRAGRRDAAGKGGGGGRVAMASGSRAATSLAARRRRRAAWVCRRRGARRSTASSPRAGGAGEARRRGAVLEMSCEGGRDAGSRTDRLRVMEEQGGGGGGAQRTTMADGAEGGVGHVARGVGCGGRGGARPRVCRRVRLLRERRRLVGEGRARAARGRDRLRVGRSRARRRGRRRRERRRARGA